MTKAVVKEADPKKPLDLSSTRPEPVAGDAGQEVAVQKESAGAVTVYDYGDDVGGGMEDLGRDEWAIPFFKIVQTNSPAAKAVRLGGLGATPGSFINQATGELYSGEEGVELIFVARDHNFIERYPFESAKGFVGIRAPDDKLVLDLREKQGKFGKLVNGSGDDATEIAEAFYLYSLLVKGSELLGQVLCPFASTQIKKYKGFITQAMAIKYPGRDRDGKPGLVNPPLWAHRWRATTVGEVDGDNSWYGWRIVAANGTPKESRISLDDPFYVIARDFNRLIKEGKAKVDFSKAEEDPVDRGQAGGGQPQGDEAGATEPDEDRIPL